MAFVLASRIAMAACPNDPASAYLDVEVQGAPDDAEMAVRLVPELRAELRLRSIELCPVSKAPPTTAGARRLGQLQVVFSTPTPSSMPVSITIDDLVTGKRSSRMIDLATVPAKTYELTIAIAADELVRASWAELLLAGEPREPRIALPKPALDTLRAQAQQTSPQDAVVWRLMLNTIVQGQDKQSAQFGAGLGLSLTWPLSLVTGLGFGFAKGAPIAGVNGEVDLLNLQTQLEVGRAFSFSKSVQVIPLLLMRAQWLRIAGRAVAPALGYDGNRFNMDGGLGVDSAVWVTPRVALVARAIAFYSARRIAITDGEKAVGSVGGLGLQLGLGARWTL